MEELAGVELLNLGACKGGLGHENAPLGMAGAGLVAGANSVLGSLWYVSDPGTMAFMTALYQNLLQEGVPKVKALQQAQIAMLEEAVSFTQEGDQLSLFRNNRDIPTQVAHTLNIGDTHMSHPYFWSAFTLSGNPW
jgi:CHAT domain-containing protein